MTIVKHRSKLELEYDSKYLKTIEEINSESKIQN